MVSWVASAYSVDPLSEPDRCENLDKLKTAEFDLDLFNKLIAKAEYKNPRINKTHWKGAHLAIIKFSDGDELRLAISHYGSFFKILGEDGIYTFSNDFDASEKWRTECDKIIKHFND